MQVEKDRNFYVYKCFYRQHPKYINDMFNVKEMPYSMRDELKSILSLVYAGAKLWNSLPVTFKTFTRIIPSIGELASSPTIGHNFVVVYTQLLSL